MNSAAVRSLVLGIPDWPIQSWQNSEANAGGSPVAILRAGRIVSCSTEARAEGVRTGMRRRDAQSRCPDLVLIAADENRDARLFAPVVARLEELTVGIQLIRPGLCVLPARGVSRYFGGELPAALALIGAAAEAGGHAGRVGVADGVFTAELAARVAEPVTIVPVGESAGFLAPLPVGALGAADVGELLLRLGIETLGAFAALDEARVRERWGETGVRLHALAAGADPAPIIPRVPPPELARQVDFEPPLTLAEQVAFSVRTTAEDFTAALVAERLVCTELRVELRDEEGGISEQLWLHPTAFDAAAVVDRVRWQLEGGGELTAPVAGVRLIPEAVDAADRHETGLFGSGGDARLHHALSRVQAMLGHEQVMTVSIGGGRRIAERQQATPWGERARPASARMLPWPGSLPPPLPATVFPRPLPVAVLDAAGASVSATARGELSGTPSLLLEGARRRRITAWAGPWPLDEREWDRGGRRALRIQAVDSEQTAWLLLLERGLWHAEGRYD